ncbi:MAG: hypothetical protein RLZZ342_4 [Candidatus Parcubacteria bacterium]|jgi:hypothetical protein
MYRRKDNLTDLVETLPKTPTSDTSQSSNDQQVVSGSGEVITLGQKPQSSANKSSLELSDLKGVIVSALEQAFDRFRARAKQNKDI